MKLDDALTVTASGLVICGSALATAALLGAVPLWVAAIGCAGAGCMLIGAVQALLTVPERRGERRELEAYRTRVAQDPSVVAEWCHQPDQGCWQGEAFWRRVMAAHPDTLLHAPAWVKQRLELCRPCLEVHPERWDLLQIAIPESDPLFERVLAVMSPHRETTAPTAQQWESWSSHPMVGRPRLLSLLADMPMPDAGSQAAEFAAWMSFWRRHAQRLAHHPLPSGEVSELRQTLTVAGALQVRAARHTWCRNRGALPELPRETLQQVVQGRFGSLLFHFGGESVVSGLQVAGVAQTVVIEGHSSIVAEADQGPSDRVQWVLAALRALRESGFVPQSAWTWECAWSTLEEALELEPALLPLSRELVIEAIAHGRAGPLGCVPPRVLDCPEVVLVLVQRDPSRFWELPSTALAEEALAAEGLYAAQRFMQERLARPGQLPAHQLVPPAFLHGHGDLMKTWLDAYPQAIEVAPWNLQEVRPVLVDWVVQNPGSWSRLPTEIRMDMHLLAALLPEAVHRRLAPSLAPAEEGTWGLMLQVSLRAPRGAVLPTGASWIRETFADLVRAEVFAQCRRQWRGPSPVQRAEGIEEAELLLDDERSQQTHGLQAGNLGQLTLTGLREILQTATPELVIGAVREACRGLRTLLEPAVPSLQRAPSPPPHPNAQEDAAGARTEGGASTSGVWYHRPPIEGLAADPESAQEYSEAEAIEIALSLDVMVRL